MIKMKPHVLYVGLIVAIGTLLSPSIQAQSTSFWRLIAPDSLISAKYSDSMSDDGDAILLRTPYVPHLWELDDNVPKLTLIPPLKVLGEAVNEDGEAVYYLNTSSTNFSDKPYLGSNRTLFKIFNGDEEFIEDIDDCDVFNNLNECYELRSQSSIYSFKDGSYNEALRIGTMSVKGYSNAHPINRVRDNGILKRVAISHNGEWIASQYSRAGEEENIYIKIFQSLDGTLIPGSEVPVIRQYVDTDVLFFLNTVDDISSNGRILLYHDLIDGKVVPNIWNNGSITQINLDYDSFRLNWISGNSEIIYASGSKGEENQLLILNIDGNLITPPKLFDSIITRTVSNYDGTVVAVSFEDGEPAIYVKNEWLTLSEVLQKNGVLPVAWNFNSGYISGISSDGSILSGTAIAPEGKFDIWRAVIDLSVSIYIVNPLNEKWMAGETNTIKWTGGEAGQFIQLEYSLDDGQTYDLIDFGIPADSGNFEWKTPKNLISTKMRIKIFDLADSLNKSVSDAFRIKPYVLTRIDQNGNYIEYLNQRDIWGFENNPDHMWIQEWYQQFDYRGIDPFTGSQYSQWQALSAFKNAPDSFYVDWISFVNAFSVDASYNKVSLGFYDWTAVKLWKSYHAKYEGACFGIAVSNALAFYKRDQFIKKYPEFPKIITDPKNVQADNEVRKVISELFAYQFGNLTYANDLASANKTPNETLEEIRQMVQADNSIVKILIIGNNNGKGSHAIIAYGLEQDESNTHIYKIKVYDNNPNTESDIIVNTQGNNNNGTWSYAERPNWGGSKWLYLDVPAELHLSDPTFPTVQNTQSHFIIPDDVVNINYPSESSIVIKDNQDNVTGLVNDVIFENIPNSYARRIKNGSEVAPLGYSLDNDNYSIVLSGFEESTVGTYFFTGNRSLVYERTGAEQTQTDRLFFDGGLSAVNPDAQVKKVSLSTLINETVNQKLLSVSSVDLVQNDSVKIFNPDSNTVKLISYGTAKDYDVELNFVSENGLVRFENFNIPLTANTSHTFVPDWTNLTNSQLLVLVDIGNNGTIDDTLTLANNVTSIQNDQGSLIVPDSYHLAQNYPNPFNPSTMISWQSPFGGQQTIKVYDVLGNEVATLVDEYREAGRYEVKFDASRLASGIYFYKLKAVDPSTGSHNGQAGQAFIQTRKMLLIK